MFERSTLSLTRRNFLRAATIGAGAVAAPGLLTACGSGEEAAVSAPTSGPLSGIKSKQVVYADFGGTTREARVKAFFDSFTKETGVKVVPTMTVDAVQAKMQDGEKGDYDALPAGVYELYRSLKLGHIEKLPADVTRNDSLDKDAQDYAWGTFIVANTQAYLDKAFPGGTGPQNWKDFWDVEKFPGKRGWPGTGYSFEGTIESALLADGVPMDELYPLDWERGFAKLDELREHMVFYTEFPQVQQFMVSGTVSVAKAPSGLFFALNNKGEKTHIVMNEAFQSANISITASGSPDKDAAFALAHWMSDGKRQAEFAKLTGYGPGNQAAFDFIEPELAKQIVNSPENDAKSLKADNHYLGEVYDEYVEKYTQWLSKK
ncbi:putative spermidine/putrescine transport system substrate-binding protein [Actinocorallia herbida]|uniref:Putative spermidine/putrescine transport system substrate-binding protein n=1 Tax=Actinocorallia herbida TaxID=58109 RepID=A0A3N1D7N0_9ACTN|nr:extracellular solute-binding protein [Actinocorallia herbida]ROO89128.1 putative spermidine/putrescine transport system substrate-binding protein [Actinocorallia herbida]